MTNGSRYYIMFDSVFEKLKIGPSITSLSVSNRFLISFTMITMTQKYLWSKFTRVALIFQFYIKTKFKLDSSFHF